MKKVIASFVVGLVVATVGTAWADSRVNVRPAAFVSFVGLDFACSYGSVPNIDPGPVLSCQRKSTILDAHPTGRGVVISKYHIWLTDRDGGIYRSIAGPARPIKVARTP